MICDHRCVEGQPLRIFHDRLTHDKYTDRKHRWVKLIEAAKFQLYIVEDRVPEPTPKIIEVSIFAHKTVYSKVLNQVGYKSVDDLTEPDKNDLAGIGLSDDMIQISRRQCDLRCCLSSSRKL